MIDPAEVLECLHQAFPGHLFSLSELYISEEMIEPFWKVWVGTPAGDWIKLKVRIRSGLFNDAETFRADVIVNKVREELEGV